MKLLVTGHRGFVGAYVLANSKSVGLSDDDGQAINLLDVVAVKRCIERERPDAVLHLAAQSFVPDSFRDPRATYDTNFTGTHGLLDALKTSGFKGRFLFVSSADVYGALPEAALPAHETTPTRPLNPYAVSKIAAETLCGYWQRAEGMDVVIARPFNHIGPGQSTRFAIADFAKTIAGIKLGKAGKVLEVGDLDVTRDFTDVRDVVAAYHLLLTHGKSGETYNICSGIERHLGDAVGLLAELAGVDIELKTDAARFRKAGQRRACGSSDKLRADTGWQPRIDWSTSLRDTLNYWENTLK
ncbi:GDP-mannose 4,6-dehydratase [uncultured Nevskia sp.]|uniref:GDP-mannose 4,6-dehydratase n=1 Tax=uncultured Nevskia sp. TaxID=228950 RepID=UPI0025E52003|nr:GDP-mannose 4,6-dehydratase [uncultured Nevskia sp.]